MKKIFKLGVIGSGFMANAIIDGILNAKLLEKQEIICSCKTNETLDKLKQKGLNATLDNKYLADNAEYILFSIKPQQLTNVFEEISNAKIDKCISILAGTKKEKFKNKFPNIKVARCMPNTPCAINSGAIGVDISDFNNNNDIDFIQNILSPLGHIIYVKEEDLNAVTGISGSSPAYFYLFAKSLIDAGLKQGLNYEQSKNFVVATMEGSAKMMKNSVTPIDELIKSVCSKGGTTIEAIKIFEQNNFSTIVNDAVDACVNRSKELEKI